MKAEIIAVGSELLTPDHLDTNSLLLTEELNRLGIAVVRKTVVGDDRSRLREAFQEAMKHAELIIFIGGLGPTEDDLTREAAAEQLGRRLVRNGEVLRGIRERFRSFGRDMPPINERQAMVPEGATVLPNPHGTAPGLWLETGQHIVVLLPGPPRELAPMVAKEVRPRLERGAIGTRMFHREVRLAGMGESHVDQRIAAIYKRYPDVETTMLAVSGQIEIHFRIWSGDRDSANKLLDELVEHIVLALGESVFTTTGESLEEVVARELTLNCATVAVAESCTGGMVAERLTTLPGSSSYFLGGVVCYSNEMKVAWADVPPALIESRGAVSAEVALALADGVRRRCGATLGLGITGIAGPGGGTSEKPVGTVHIALASPNGEKERGFRFPGDRERIRMQASLAALDMVRRYFLYARAAKG